MEETCHGTSENTVIDWQVGQLDQGQVWKEGIATTQSGVITPNVKGTCIFFFQQLELQGTRRTKLTGAIHQSYLDTIRACIINVALHEECMWVSSVLKYKYRANLITCFVPIPKPKSEAKGIKHLGPNCIFCITMQ